MANGNGEWELSKENIQPIQQGRKPEVLKVALTTQPEDLIGQQKQAFETELRTYTGDDPLAVWHQYIKWVEQNFPKGGRDGHLHQLLRQCLSQLISKTQYYNDKRFVKIWLKYANCSQKAIDVYENMYSRNIGCEIAHFFMAWAWELEQHGNLKRANEVLNDGIQRRAEPLDKLKAYRCEFEMRVGAKIMAGLEPNNDQEENGRSAFSILKPQKKKNLAPVVRTGASIIEPNRSSMTLGRQQPLPRNNLPSGKVPFKIYNAENIAPSLPVQSEAPAPFTLYSDTFKENEKKPSKWNKVKVKQMSSAIRYVEEADPGFKLHCDGDSQPESTPRSVPKVSNILRVRKEHCSPEMANFEKPDPMKRPMYDKFKVYGGGEEFSLEEIRAAAWFKIEKQRFAECERQLKEQQDMIKSLEQQVQLLQTVNKKTNIEIFVDSNPSSDVNKICVDPSPLSTNKLQNYAHNIELVNSCSILGENSNVDLKAENIENIPPEGYLQEKNNKRELAGILLPSKNITFIPLEEQSEEHEENSESEIEDEGLYNENNNHPVQDETIIPPCNTEQFVSAAFLASTPCAHVKTTKLLDLPDSKTNSNVVCEELNNSPQKNVNSDAFQVPVEEIPCNTKQVNKTEARTSIRDHSTFPGLQGQLSVILETSSECYKSSSSSGSSASVTRLSQFSQCYSHEKSNIQKHLSKTDHFKEPRPVLHSRDLSNIITNDNSLSAFKEPKPVVKNQTNDVFEIHSSDIDPFDENLRLNLLKSTSQSNEIYVSKKHIKAFKVNEMMEIGNTTYTIDHLIAEGAYGKVYQARSMNSHQQGLHSRVALKACKEANEWEYYICTTLHKRLKQINSIPDIRLSIMEIISACKFSNGMVLISEFSQQGTLLDLVNMFKNQNNTIPESFAFYLTLEILQIVKKLHECKIIHADIKPDNLLVRDNVWDLNIMESLAQKTSVLKLIDFGRAIDLTAFKSGICFTTILKENCIEMRENKPWLFQLDWYGVLNCIHVILFSEYMKVRQNATGRWEIEKRFKRYWDQTIWAPLFDELLNIPSCYVQPNLEKFTNLIISKLRKNEMGFITYFRRISNFYEQKPL